MAISVYSIYFFALLVAFGAAILSVEVLLQTFAKQQAQREESQRDTGIGQVKAIQSLVLAQFRRMRTVSEGNLNQFYGKAYYLPPDVFHSDLVVAALNETMFRDWVPQARAVGELGLSFGLSLLYPPEKPTFDRSFSSWEEQQSDGSNLYMYSHSFTEDNLLHAFGTTWIKEGGALLPQLGPEKYPYDWFSAVKNTYQNDDFYDQPLPWASSDGYPYWYFTHQRAFTLHGVPGVMQTWDDAISWRERMLSVRVPGSEFVVFDSNGHMLSTTNEEETHRLDSCSSLFVQGLLDYQCIGFPAAEYPVDELRQMYLALDSPEWHNLSAPVVPFRALKIAINGTEYMTVAGTIISEDRLRITIVWYQPWAKVSGNIYAISVLIGAMTILATLVLTVMGIFGILRPLLRLGRGMRAVARSLREGEQDATFLARKPSPFTEVDRIARDFETIVVDFLGFSNKVVRDNRNAPKDDAKPFGILFTDIESSTGLWGFDPASMSRCLQVHHELIRDLIAAHNLYEVKTVGDSFMIASGSATAMIRFAMDLQVTFYRQDWDWPEVDEFYGQAHKHDLNGSGSCWSGLRVRVGVHFGTGDIVYDEVTKGYDYYGTVVNTAARIEAVAHGGQVLMSEAMLAEGGICVDPTQFVVEPLGVQPLRGVEDPPALIQMTPIALKDRQFPSLRLEKGDDSNTARVSNLSMARSVASAGECPSPCASVFRHHNADDFARNHSLVRAGILPLEFVSRHLQSLRVVMEELLLPVAPQQQRSTCNAILSGWGVPLPRTDRQLPSALLQVAQRMAETPKALLRLHSAHGACTIAPEEVSGRQASSVCENLL